MPEHGWRNAPSSTLHYRRQSCTPYCAEFQGTLKPGCRSDYPPAFFSPQSTHNAFTSGSIAQQVGFPQTTQHNTHCNLLIKSTTKAAQYSPATSSSLGE